MKIKSQISAGECTGTWYPGVVDRVQGNGYYAAVRGSEGNLHYVNYSYTDFYPSNQRLWQGEQVDYTLYPKGWPNEGKISCVSQVR